MDQAGVDERRGPVAMGHRGSPPPSEAAPAAFWGGRLPRSMGLATARQIHGSLIHVYAPPTIQAVATMF
eukprot:517323-Pyramimonas_sp.AAC.1